MPSWPVIPWWTYMLQPVAGWPGCFWRIKTWGAQIVFHDYSSGQLVIHTVGPILPYPVGHPDYKPNALPPDSPSSPLPDVRPPALCLEAWLLWTAHNTAVDAVVAGLDPALDAQAAKEAVFKLMSEKDTGQVTTNPHILAARWIQSGQLPTCDIMTQVLKLEANPVTPDELALCAQLLKDGVKLQGTLATVTKEMEGLFPSPSGRGSIPRRGVYILHSLIEQAVGVGSAKDLRHRCNMHLTQADTKVGQYVRDHGPQSLSVTFLVLPEVHQDDARLQVILEQWCFFMLFGVEDPGRVINRAMVANGGGDGGVMTQATLDAMRASRGAGVHVVLGGVYLGFIPSLRLAATELGVSRTSINRWLTSGLPLHGTSLTFFTGAPVGIPYGLLPLTELVTLVKATLAKQAEDAKLVTLSGRYDPTPGAATTFSPKAQGTSAPVEAECTTCGTVLTAPSLKAMAKLMQAHNGKGSTPGISAAFKRCQGKPQTKYLMYLITLKPHG